MKLLIGNKNYSSWSLRPWLLLRHAGIPFEEELISFNAPDFGERVRRYSPVGKVPVLVDGDVVIWDSLAIAEYVAEKYPEKKLWPEAPKARAHARSLCAEMHAGFGQLRSRMPMNCSVDLRMGLIEVGVQRDIDRVVDLWQDCRAKYGENGPFLFGAFTVADAFFAPVTRRFVTYGVAMPELAARYRDAMGELPAMKEWLAGARKEDDFVPEDEPYRRPP